MCVGRVGSCRVRRERRTFGTRGVLRIRAKVGISDTLAKLSQRVKELSLYDSRESLNANSKVREKRSHHNGSIMGFVFVNPF